MEFEIGASATGRHTVAHEDTARHLGSGDLLVLGTPRLVAWCEQATIVAIATRLDSTATTVGTQVSFVHHRATIVGAEVHVQADLVQVDGRSLRFKVRAFQSSDGSLMEIAHGSVTRVIVDRAKFLGRLDVLRDGG